MALNYVDDSATIGTTEYFLASDSTTKTDQTDDCMLQAWIDFANMAAGDQYRVRIYEKVNGAGATQRQIMEAILTGAQAGPWVSPALMVGHGWEVSVTKLTGTDRSIGWSLRKAT
jgi:hypothetical protein